MIVTTEAVVLKGMNYRETSKIVTLYTRSYGKLSVLAKGARDRKNRFGSALEPMSYVTAVFYKKEERELQLLSQCDLVKPLRHLSDDLDRMAAAIAVVELVDAVTHPEERSEPLFALLVDTLSVIHNATKYPIQALYLFEVRLLDLMGFRPNFRTCFHCGKPIGEGAEGAKGIQLHVSYGGLLCHRCSEKGMGVDTISVPAVKILQWLQEISEIDAVTRLAMSPGIRKEVVRTLRRYLESHIEGMRTLRSRAVFATIMENS